MKDYIKNKKVIISITITVVLAIGALVNCINTGVFSKSDKKIENKFDKEVAVNVKDANNVLYSLPVSNLKSLGVDSNNLGNLSVSIVAITKTPEDKERCAVVEIPSDKTIDDIYSNYTKLTTNTQVKDIHLGTSITIEVSKEDANLLQNAVENKQLVLKVIKN